MYVFWCWVFCTLCLIPLDFVLEPDVHYFTVHINLLVFFLLLIFSVAWLFYSFIRFNFILNIWLKLPVHCLTIAFCLACAPIWLEWQKLKITTAAAMNISNFQLMQYPLLIWNSPSSFIHTHTMHTILVGKILKCDCKQCWYRTIYFFVNNVAKI